jgi:undecaprenyl-diphosphatase
MLYLLTLIGILATAVTFVYDEAILTWVVGIQTPILTQFMMVITYVGALYAGIPLLLMIIYAAEKRNKEVFWNSLAAILITIVITWMLKLFFNRDRPTDTAFGFYDEAFKSFPSGHASISFAVFSTLADYHRKYSVVFYVFAALVAFSRVYLGAHYGSDVIFGAMLGILFSTLTIEAGIGNKLKKALFKK